MRINRLHYEWEIYKDKRDKWRWRGLYSQRKTVWTRHMTFCSRHGGATINKTFHPLMPTSLRRERASEKRIMHRRFKQRKQMVKQAFHNYKYQSRENNRQRKLNERPWHQKLADKVRKQFAGRGR